MDEMITKGIADESLTDKMSGLWGWQRPLIVSYYTDVTDDTKPLTKRR